MLKQNLVQFAKTNPWCTVFTGCLVFSWLMDIFKYLKAGEGANVLIITACIAIFVGAFLYFLDELIKWVDENDIIYVIVLILISSGIEYAIQ